MILRNKIIIGSLIAIPAGAITGVVVSSFINDDKVHEIRFDDDFILAVNTAYEATSTLIEDHNHDIVPLLGNASISYNNLERNFVLDLKPLFSSFDNNASTPEENFANLLKIGKSFGVIKTYLRYVKTNKPFLTANSLQFSTDYLNEQKGTPIPKTLEQITGVAGSEIDKQEKARDDISKYDIDGLTNVRVPAVDADGNLYKGAVLKKDIDHPSFVNPFTNKIEDATIDKRNTIREAILYQAIKLAKVADMYGQTIQFKNISAIDKISDSSIAEFTYNSSTKIGSYLSVRNHSTEAMIKILLLGSFKGMQRTFKSIATEADKNNLGVADMRNFHKYSLPTTDYPILSNPANGMTKNDKEAVKKLRSDNPTHYGVVITDDLITLQNPFKFEPAMVTRASDKIDGDLLKQIASSHSGDEKSYTHFYGKNAYKKFAHYAGIYGKNLKNFSFYDPSGKPPKRLIGANQRSALEKSGIEWFGDTGSKPQFLNKPAMFYKKVKTDLGDLLITSGHNLITKYIKRGFREDGTNAPYKANAFLNKIDPQKLYEDNTATIPGFNSHSELSLDHPFVLGDQDLGLVTINLARNYRTSKNTQARKVYTKDEMKKDIFKDPTTATDDDLLQWFAILATMLEDKLTISGAGPDRDVNIDATFAINTSMSDAEIIKLLPKFKFKKIVTESNTIEEAPNSVMRDKGYIIFNKELFAGQKDIIKKVFKAIFTKDNFTFANLDGIDDATTTANKMKFTEAQIDTAFTNAKTTMADATFKKAWSKSSTSYTSTQKFAKESDALQNNYNKVIKDTFVKYAYDQAHTQSKPETIPTLAESKFYSLAGGSGIPDFNMKEKDDYYIRGMDLFGDALTLRSPGKILYRNSGKGNRVPAKFSSGVDMMLEYDVSIDKFFFRGYDIEGTTKWITGKGSDERIIQYLAMIYLNDKFKVHQAFSVIKDDAAKAGLAGIFGANNVSTQYELVYGKKEITSVELTLGKGKDAIKSFIEKTYLGLISDTNSVAYNMWQKQLAWINKIDAAITKNSITLP